MKARLMALGVPSLFVGALLGSAYGWKTLGMSPRVWNYVWPSLVALALLAFALGFLYMRARKLAWPLLAGFVAQVVGILLYLVDVHEKPVETIWWTIWTVVIAAFVVLVVWLATFLRARWLERKMLEGVGADGADQQKVEQIRKDMLGALSLLKKAGSGRNAIYELPWFLVIGRSQAGKSVAIKNSGLGLPVRKDWVKGVGGTHTCDWFFTNDLIFLDTPGAWVTEGANDDAQEYWKTLLKLLRKYRGRRPLDGLVVVVPADDLLSKTEGEIQEQAGNIREVIDLLHDELHFRFPVYVLVSKCDLVEGFVDFFRRVAPQRWHEIVGWSNPDPDSGKPVEIVPKAFQRVLRRLRAYRLELIARIGRARHARKIFFFPEDFKRLERPLTHFVDVLFYEDPSHETPVFRGFYFTSGTQGDGSVLGQAMAQLARNLGVRLTGSAEDEKEEPKRSYFLLELFRRLMVSDEGLVSRTAGHWWRRRRDTIYAAFLPAGIAACVLFFALVSYLLNLSIYANVKSEVPKVVAALDALGPEPDPRGAEIEKALGVDDGGVEEIRGYHRAISGFHLFRSLGMLRPGGLEVETFRIFDDEFVRTLLRPTLRRAQEAALDLDQTLSCNEQIDAFYAVVWLRGARKAESEDDLKAFAKLWDLPPDEAARARDKFLTQFRYLVKNRGGNESFLPGFSLSTVASRIKADCFGRGSGGSGLESYLAFQRQCREPSGRDGLEACVEQLREALNYQNESFKRLRAQVYTLGRDLETLAHDRENTEPEADEAWDIMKGVEVADTSGNECLESFNKDVAATVNNYFKEQKELIGECKDARQGSSLAQAKKVLQEQRKKEESAMADTMKIWANRCEASLKGYNAIDPPTLFGFLRRYRWCECAPEFCASTPPPPIPPPIQTTGSGSTKGPRVAKARPATRSARVYVRTPARPDEYEKRDWESLRRDWQERLDAADVDSDNVERNRVRNEVEAYAGRYVKAWQEYLAGIRLEDARGSIPAWLGGLAETTELAEALQPAAEAVAEQPQASSEELDGFRLGLERMKSVHALVYGQLPQYQSQLRKVAKDLAAFETSTAAWSQYRQSLNGPGNSLYDARDWVDKNAAGVAMGSLRLFFMAPLDVAEEYVKTSTTNVERRWEDLRKAYDKVSDLAPFNPKSDKLVELPDLRALLGGRTGLVPNLQEVADGAGLGQNARDWLARASDLSAVFFEAQEDKPKPLKLQLAVDTEFAYDPPKMQEEYRVQSIKMAWGGGSEFNWSQDEPEQKQKKVEIPLFGEDANPFSEITVIPAKKGRTLTFKVEWEPADPWKKAAPTGPWAQLRLLVLGLPQGGAGAGSDLALTYDVPVQIGRKKQGAIGVKIHVSAPKLGRLLQLAEKGLPPPPERPTE